MWTKHSRVVFDSSKIPKQDYAICHMYVNIQDEKSKQFDCSLLRTGRILGRPKHKKGTRMLVWV